MSDDDTRRAPPPPIHPPPPAPAGGGRGLGWFFAVSGAVVLFLTLGCIFAVTDGRIFGPDTWIAFVCGSPTLALGGLFLWLGVGSLKR